METVGIEPTSETISNSSHPQAWEIFLNQQNFSDLTVTRDRFLFDLYELPITVATATYQQTFDLQDGESADFETRFSDWGIPEDAGVIYDLTFEILYSDTQENLGGSACDSVTTVPDFSGAEGPLEIVDDAQQTNEQCDVPVVVAYVYLYNSYLA